jgi:hypothetical protein
MPKIVIHCGAHKTASTLIQRELRSKKKELLAKGIQYINPWYLNQRGIESEVIPAAARREYARVASIISQTFEPLIEKTKSPVLLMSHESIFGYSSLYKSNIKNQFYPLLPDIVEAYRMALSSESVSIIFYIRRQDTFLNSLFLEYAYCGFVNNTFEKWLEGISIERLSWLRLANALRSVFGQENVTVRPYELIKKGVKVFMNDFLSHVMPGISFSDWNDTPERVAFSKTAYELAVRCLPLLNQEDKRIFSKFLKDHFSGSAYEKANFISDTVSKKILDVHRFSNYELFLTYIDGFPFDYYDLTVQ